MPENGFSVKPDFRSNLVHITNEYAYYMEPCGMAVKQQNRGIDTQKEELWETRHTIGSENESAKGVLRINNSMSSLMTEVSIFSIIGGRMELKRHCFERVGKVKR